DAVYLILSDCRLEVVNRRWTQKALYLHRDALLSFLGCHGGPVRGYVNIHLAAAKRQRKRVMGDRPAVGDEGLHQGVVIDVPRGHCATSVYHYRSASSQAGKPDLPQ